MAWWAVVAKAGGRASAFVRWTGMLGDLRRRRGVASGAACGCAGSGCVLGAILFTSITAAVGALVSPPRACDTSVCTDVRGGWVAPISCPRLSASQGYGETPWEHPHTGIDLVCPPATEVRATHGGVFHQRNGGEMRCMYPAGKTGGLGLFAEVDSARITLVFGHLEAFALRDGVRVTPGEVLGFEGTSGCSSGFHLHYQVEVDGRVVDPCPFLPEGYPSTHTAADTRCWGAAPP